MESVLVPFTIIESVTINEGETSKCQRVFKDGVISIKNSGEENAGTLVRWKNELNPDQPENEFTLEIAPGTTIDFEIPRGVDGAHFLDRVCVELVCGGPIEISSLVPSSALN